MADEMGERTELPTARRMSEARGKGQVAKSQDLSAAVDLLSGVLLLVFAGGYIARSFLSIMHHSYTAGGEGWSTDATTIGPLSRMIAIETAKLLGPLLLVTAITTAFSQFLQVGWLLTAKPLEPKLSKLSPIAGVKRILSKRSLVKSAVNSVKLVFIIAVASGVIMSFVPRIIGLPTLTAPQGMIVIARMMFILAMWLAVILLLIGLIDWIYQKWQHKEELKMTKQQVKDERRSMEGDPQVKGRRMQMMRDIFVQQIQANVPTADVVVTNPTHFAVALRYDTDTMRAPRVVAKGGDYMAQRIRLVAASAGVPIVERPPLARGLYFGTEVGQEISPVYYEAVAEILAYVYRLDAEAERSNTKTSEHARQTTSRTRETVGAA
ncbi:MAG: flagellar biosynthesis protein FlhB [Planctomycetota bacterium]|nr:flagellar biosynthesis protein FlhB [Planctomycetota bacterium]